MHQAVYATTAVAADGLFDVAPGARVEVALANMDRDYALSDGVRLELVTRDLMGENDKLPHEETLAALAALAATP